MSIQSHRQLEVWQKAIDLACGIYHLTRQMPKEETYRLFGQIIRCSTSIPANIAEGNGRATRRDYAHFVSIARGSAAELETFLIIIRRLGLAPESQLEPLLIQTQQVGRMLTVLRTRLSAPATPNP